MPRSNDLSILLATLQRGKQKRDRWQALEDVAFARVRVLMQNQRFR
jgi:hypothetical protein